MTTILAPLALSRRLNSLPGGTFDLGRVAQQAERLVDRKSSGMAQVVDGEVAGSKPAPANTFSAARGTCSRCIHGIRPGAYLGGDL